MTESDTKQETLCYLPALCNTSISFVHGTEGFLNLNNQQTQDGILDSLGSYTFEQSKDRKS